MTSTPNLNDFIDNRTRRQLDTCLKRTMSALEHENTVMAQTPMSAFQRLLKVYTSVKPVLAFLGSFPLVPLSVRTAVNLLTQTLEAVSESGPAIVAQFKAGKDLEPAA